MADKVRGASSRHADAMSRAFVCGCQGKVLTREERDFLRDSDPFGLILFKRNVETPAQVRALIADFAPCGPRRCCARRSGGRAGAAARAAALARLSRRRAALAPSICRWRAGRRWCARPRRCLAGFARPRHHNRLRAGDGRARSGAHDVIGDRAFSRDPGIVARLGRAARSGLADAGILPIMKHIPGHGPAGSTATVTAESSSVARSAARDRFCCRSRPTPTCRPR